MDEEKVFKRYDIRGVYPEELDEKFAELLGKSLGTFIQNKEYSKKLVVCRDNKNSSKPLKSSFIDGVLATGIQVIDIGTGPTDFAAFSGMKKDCVSVQVTASHLSLKFNGFKFMYPQGNGFVNEDLNKVKTIFRERNFSQSPEAELKKDRALSKSYREDLKSFVESKGEEWDKKIVVDTMGGATSSFLPSLLKGLGAEVVDLGDSKDRMPYRDPPNPKPGKLSELKQAVEENDADIGLATDMDGDRVTLYKNGFISGNSVFAVFTKLFDGDKVASLDTSKAVEQVAESKGEEVFYTRVGDPFVLEKALDVKASLAGEPNGHYAFLGFTAYSSGILSALILSGLDLEAYLEDLPRYYSERRSISVKNKEERMRELEKIIEKQYTITSKADGLKIGEENFQVLVRPSGSSSKIRVITESKDPSMASEVVERFEKLVRNS